MTVMAPEIVALWWRGSMFDTQTLTDPALAVSTPRTGLPEKVCYGWKHV